MDNTELWQSVLAQMQFQVSRANFATWLKGTKILSCKDGNVVVGVENSFSKEWLDNKYSSLILKILRSLNNEIKSVSFVISPSYSPPKKTQPSFEKTIPNLTTQSRLQGLEINPATNLNPRYTFDNFVVGSFNELAHAAAWAVSEKPGITYNPLFIYGGVGLGKTHLIQATGNRITDLHPEKRVRYEPSERFISDIIEAIKNHTIDELKRSFKEIDVLIVDDVQFFGGKEKSQEEFFHIFNLLYHSQKQLILSSDRSPKAIPALQERLRSRFEGGMLADIGIPDLETRIAILKAKCEENETELPSDIISYVASVVRNNIREIEGALNRLVVFKKINDKDPSLEECKKLITGLVKQPKRTTTFKEILKETASVYGLNPVLLKEKTRRKEIVKARQVAMYLLREELNESYPSIARRFGGKDHTTVIYSCKKIEQEIKEDDTLLNEINLIRQKLYSEF